MSPISHLSSSINLLTLLRSSPSKRKIEQNINNPNKRLNCEVTVLNSGPNTESNIRCSHCNLYGHQLIRHKDCLKNPKRMTADNNLILILIFKLYYSDQKQLKQKKHILKKIKYLWRMWN